MNSQKWIVCDDEELAAVIKQWGYDSLEYHIAINLHRMMKTGIIKRKTHMVIVAREDIPMPNTIILLGKTLPVYRDNRIRYEQTGEIKTSTVYLMSHKDYKRMMKHAG